MSHWLWVIQLNEIFRCKALHTPYNVFIVNLSIIGKSSNTRHQKCQRAVTKTRFSNFNLDFLTATCMMPLNVTGYILKRWPLGGPDHISCSIQAFVYFCCGYTSIVCLLVITINRFIIIIYRDLYIQVFSKRNVSSSPEVSRNWPEVDRKWN